MKLPILQNRIQTSTQNTKKMGYFYIQQKRDKENHKTIQGYSNKNSISNSEHHTKHNKMTSVKRQIQSEALQHSMVWVRERTIPTERPPLVGKVIANFCG
jgi:hypothetical protein